MSSQYPGDWDDHDPHGCAALAAVIAIGSVVVYGAAWWFFGLQGVVALVLFGVAVIAAFNVIAWSNRR